MWLRFIPLPPTFSTVSLKMYLRSYLHLIVRPTKLSPSAIQRKTTRVTQKFLQKRLWMLSEKLSLRNITNTGRNMEPLLLWLMKVWTLLPRPTLAVCLKPKRDLPTQVLLNKEIMEKTSTGHGGHQNIPILKLQPLKVGTLKTKTTTMRRDSLWLMIKWLATSQQWSGKRLNQQASDLFKDLKKTGRQCT